MLEDLKQKVYEANILLVVKDNYMCLWIRR